MREPRAREARECIVFGRLVQRLGHRRTVSSVFRLLGIVRISGWVRVGICVGMECSGSCSCSVWMDVQMGNIVENRMSNIGFFFSG